MTFVSKAAIALAITIAAAAPAAAAVDQARLRQQVGHELAMLPYVSTFDYLTYQVDVEGKVTLGGYTVRPTNRKSAERVVSRIETVSAVENNIEVLPLSSFDRRIRAGVRANLQRFLSRYFMGTSSQIRIIVRNGDVWLYGQVDTERDKNMATIQTNGVRGVFAVHNELGVTQPPKSSKKKSKKNKA